MYFQELIECPECGLHTHELTKATSDRKGEKTLMCDTCRMDTDESLGDWDEQWDDFIKQRRDEN